jgi:hypothetical protein
VLYPFIKGGQCRSHICIVTLLRSIFLPVISPCNKASREMTGWWTGGQIIYLIKEPELCMTVNFLSTNVVLKNFIQITFYMRFLT